MTNSVQEDVNARQQETAFNDAAAVLNNEIVAPTSQLDRFNELQSIIAFLERPTVIWQSRITSSSPVLTPLLLFDNPRGVTQTPLKTFYFPRDLMLVGGKGEKIRNFEWFKTDVKLRVLINANPFIAGRLYITYSPVDKEILNFAQIEHKGRAGVTSYPGVEIDLQTNTAAELLVPWINEADAESSDPNLQSLFRVDIWLLTPLLLADNSLSIPITVFASFANVSLKFPTPMTNGLPGGTHQMEAKGPIEEIASGIGRISNKLTNVPIISPIAQNAKWASDKIGGVASAFGWSRPIEGSNATAFSHIPGRGMGQFKSKDSGVVLGMSNDNEIVEDTINFISDKDEMSLEHICSRPGLIETVEWNTSHDFNSMLSGYSCTREAVDNTSSRVNTKYYTVGEQRFRAVDPVLSEYILDNFHMYRADWHFRISLVKTAFHVGRLEFVFVPNKPANDIPDDLDTTNAYRQIFDITEQNEFEFVVPFNHKFIMFRKDPQRVKAAPTTGSLYIRVNSPLTCPATVSQSIKILVWKYATNVVAAYPTIADQRPSMDNSIPVVRTGVHQINVTNENKNVAYCVFDKQNTFEQGMTAAKTVAGENCLNLREACKAFRWVRNFDQLEIILPNNVTYKLRSYLGVCANIFYFFRGGLSYKIVSWKGQNLYSFISSNPADDVKDPDLFQNCPFHFTPANNPVHEVTMPFYSQSRRQICNYLPDTSDDRLVRKDEPFVRVLSPGGTQPTALDVFMAAKDDFSFGFLIGAPILDNKFL